MGKENGFVPIDEANTDKISFAVDLPPYLDRTLVRAHPERIESFMKLAGISKLGVETFEDDRYQEYPAVVGFGTDGSAYSGKTATKKEQGDLNMNIHKRMFYEQPTAEVNIKIDIKQMADEVISQDLRSEGVWGNRIDKKVNSGIRESGNRVLLVENTLYDLDKLLFQGFFISRSVMSGSPLLLAIDIVAAPQVLKLGRRMIGIRERKSFLWVLKWIEQQFYK